MSTRTIKSRGTVTIDTELCKGCELCIPVCPPNVLDMSTAVNSRGFRYPRLRPGCTGCAACVMVCPDFCFEIYKFATPTEHTVEIGTETGGPS
jgi:2-oxoglutarate ferredoxin oxidoreductase subunit delta